MAQSSYEEAVAAMKESATYAVHLEVFEDAGAAKVCVVHVEQLKVPKSYTARKYRLRRGKMIGYDEESETQRSDDNEGEGESDDAEDE